MVSDLPHIYMQYNLLISTADYRHFDISTYFPMPEFLLHYLYLRISLISAIFSDQSALSTCSCDIYHKDDAGLAL